MHDSQGLALEYAITQTMIQDNADARPSKTQLQNT